jgi:putative membrane-bound dehydrogenase-like protein
MTRSPYLWHLAVLLGWLPAASAWAQGFPPEEAVRRMQLPDGFQARLVACEPMIRQPVTMSFDDRGRMWVIQYLQYPTPAGLKPVKMDQYLRTIYDRVPEPPPKGPKGADRITILSDPDDHGRYRQSKDFLAGLNLASGMCLGYGGVFVAQPPYLLFYPDKNGDDRPDGDPQVLLSGFGMQDAHAFPNSLQWGPDGWLYGAQGSTVTSNIRGIEFQQGIWRYHPVTKEFELFAEGGGNTWGLDFDRHGNVIAGTNWGGFVMLHQVQGAYYIKGFGKHGPLHNPHTYGYFDHVPYTSPFKGGHVTCGGIIYQGDAYPAEYRGQYIAGNLLGNAVYRHALSPSGSSFTSRFAGDFLIAHDTWFRPVDLLTGPDGCVYIADWYDKRATHLDPVDNWDRTNGRIYKIEHRRAGGVNLLRDLAARPLGKRSSQELVGLLNHPNDWYAREARRVLQERRDPAVIPTLRNMVLENRGQLALEALWALYVSGGFNDALADQLLNHPNEDVRTWTVRFLGDAKKVSPALEKRLITLAHTDPSPTVRSQLACSAKRLPAAQGLPIVRELLRRTEDLNDPHIPLLLWWAIEDKAVSDRDRVLGLLGTPADWTLPLVHRYLIERLGRRYLAEGTDAGMATCARLLAAAPGPDDVDLLVRGMEKALEGRRLSHVPAPLEKPLADLWSRRSDNLGVVRLALRLGSEPAYERALHLAADPHLAEADRITLIEVLGQAAKAKCVPVLLHTLDEAASDRLRAALLSALQPYPDPQIARRVLALYPRFSPSLRGTARTLLCSRPASALAFLQAADTGAVNVKDIPLDDVHRLAQYKDPRLTRLLEMHWGKVGPATAGEKLTRIRYVGTIIQTGKGDRARGHLLFQKTCATCHTLFGEGNKIGPDLTGADRKNRDWLLTNIVDPSAMIRPEYVSQVVVTNDGRSLTGLVVESTPQAITLVDSKNERTVLARDKIEEMTPSPVSIMPEKILDPFDDQQLRDLFSYLQGDGPVASAGRGSPSAGRGSPSAGRGSPSAGRGSPDPAPRPLKVCLVSGSLEYESDKSLGEFQKYLESHFPVKCSRAFRKSDDDLPGLESLETCDVMLLFTRRLTIKGEQLERVKKYCRAGKPIVGVRTASHAFQNWLALDREVLGGNYKNHYGVGPPVAVRIVDRNVNHPVLRGVKPFSSAGSLYKNPSLPDDDTVLLTGTIPGHTEPVAWVRVHNGGRVFYTSLGQQKDFQDENFKRLLVNALFWTTGHEPPK